MVGRRLLLALVCSGAFIAASGTARAQTGSSSGTGSAGSGSEAINASYPNPNRFLFQNGQYVNVTNTPRPQNLNPTGVNFTDCEQDIELSFPLLLSGFQASDYASVQVWAGTLDCTQDANRTGSGAGVSHPCWKVGAGTGPQTAGQLPITLNVFARDVLRYENPELPITNNNQYDGTWHNSKDGETACFVQTSDAAVQISIYFLAVNSSDQALGTAYQYPLTTDLVAPPPPPSLTLNAGDSLLQANWTTPGNDPDIVGFAVFADPPGASESTGSCGCTNSVASGANSYVGDGSISVPGEEGGACMDAESDASEDGATSGSDASMMDVATDSSSETGTGAPDASVSDASSGASPDSGLPDAAAMADAAGGDAATAGTCTPSGITVGGAEGGSCYSAALENSRFVVGGGSSSVPVTTIDDAGQSVSSGDGGVTLSGGGISSINPKYEVGEIDDYTATQMTLTGLTNGDTYTVVLSSIDGSGNIGPTSVAACGTPKPTNDYWKTYKKDDGGAGGCALESGDGSSGQVPLFALGLAAAAAAFIRRRTRR